LNGLDSIPGAAKLRDTVVWRRLRHRISLLVDPRTNSHFTGFLRLPTQFEALVGPVVSSLEERRNGSLLSICILGCSNGAEAYTVASLIRRRHPELPFTVRGYDIDAACVEQAKTARYSHDEIFNNKIMTQGFVEWTFDRDGESYRVKPRIAEHVEFAVGDVLSSDLQRKIGTHDIIFAQNFLFHLKPALARNALENISRLVRPGSALFLDGVDINQRRNFVRKKGFTPLDHEIERIHNEARRARAVGWPYSYWGLEPFLTTRRDWRARYATIFIAP
jgi:chemotaxis protein methyltransferase CheR